MSGRVRWQRDGETVTGYRKTDRRQGKRRPLNERLREINLRFARRGGADVPPIRLAFLLPQALRPLVTNGAHGANITVFARGFVRISGHSAEQCFILARRFFADVAREEPGFTVLGSIIDARAPDNSYGRHLVVAAPRLIVAGGHVEPRIYEGS